jgi:streptogramin lyase
MKREAVVSFLLVGLFLGSMFPMNIVWASTFSKGDVFAAVSNGLVYHYSANGTYLETLNCNFGGTTTGMAFDSAGNLYVTELSNAYITEFAGPGDPHTILNRIYSGNPGALWPESIVFDAAGNFYVGHANGSRLILKYNATGSLVANYSVAVESMGSDWIDLAADQHTVFYTSEGKSVKRFDLGNNTQLADFATGLPGSFAFALRILPDRTVLVADTQTIVRLNSTGSVIQTYNVTGENLWFSLNLDPDGQSFWSGSTGKFYKFNIISGAVLLSVDTGTGGNFAGLTVYGEITVARPVHDVAVTSVASSKDGCLPMPTVGQGFNAKLNVTVANEGGYTETFNTTAYATATIIGSENVTLPAGNSTTVTFTWNTTGLAYGNYTLSAYAWPVPGETNTANNNFTGGTVKVTIPGDINGDGTVNILDSILLSNAFLATPSSSNWNPNADINGDGIVNILDAIILANHFLQHYP